MTVDVKICGLQNEAGVKAAVDAGARYIGFVFHPPSRRFVTPLEAGMLLDHVPSSVTRVGLFVDAVDDYIRRILQEAALDLIQLHGNETPQRATKIRAMTGIPVMKALCIATADDLKPVASFEAVCDRILFDTKTGAEPSGGTGKSFDWTLLQGLSLKKPWMLAGGLNAANLAEAVRVSGAKTVDVSSGVEDASGQKDPAKIREFVGIAAKLG